MPAPSPSSLPTPRSRARATSFPTPVPAAALAVLLGACSDSASLYVALDEEFSRAFVQAYEQRTGESVQARYDSEAAKTVGLVSAIIEEQADPRCDVFWNNELAHTVRLAQLGLLEPYASPAAATVPAQFRDKEQRWTAFAARARILVVNTDILKDPREWPRSIRDLGDPKWKGRIAIARPLTGTTLTHFTALRRTLGEQEFEKFFASLLQNDVRWLAGNGATLRETAAGKVVFALTDTDDYHVAKQKGQPVACVFPDQGDGQLGTMLIPNSVAVLKNCRHPEAARRLVDAILDRSNEATLAAGPSAQIPVRPDVPGPKDPSILAPDKCSLMAWDVEWTAANLAASSKDFATRFGM